MKARLAFTSVAIAAVLAILGWGLFPGMASKIPGLPGNPVPGTTSDKTHSQPSASMPARTSPYVSRPTVPDVTKMRLAFDGSFTGSTLNTSVWNTCYPWVTSHSAGCTNFSNPEQEWYLPSQVRVANGEVNLVAQHIATSGLTQTGARKEYACRTGMVTTHPSFNFKYGYVQVVARIPAGAELWPAIWLAASNLKWPPEMDLLEHWGPPLNISGVYFHPIGGAKLRTRLPKSVDLALDWHTFSLNWTRSQVTWYLDGRVIMSVKQNIPHQRMYFVANLAHFSNKRLRTVACSGTLRIRSVKIWQP